MEVRQSLMAEVLLISFVGFRHNLLFSDLYYQVKVNKSRPCTPALKKVPKVRHCMDGCDQLCVPVALFREKLQSTSMTKIERDP
jgi:hypothetical protein